MPCYRITVACPLFNDYRVNVINRLSFEHILHHCGRTKVYDEFVYDNHKIYNILLCDLAVADLHDMLPSYYFVVRVIDTRGEELYLNSRLPFTKRIIPPKGDYVKKRIYWTAMSREREMMPFSKRIAVLPYLIARQVINA